MAKKDTIITLDDLELTNNDLFIRKSCTDLDKNAKVIVEETHSAILIKDGQIMNTLSAGKYPIFDKKDKDISRVDVIYMSKTARLKALWGTINRLQLRDYDTELPIELCANGEYEVQIKEPRKFYQVLVGADKNYNLDKLKERLQGTILNEIEPLIAKTIREEKLSYTDLTEKKQELAKKVYPELAKIFDREYGLNLFSFIISKAFIPAECLVMLESAKLVKREEEKTEKTAKEIAKEIERLDDKNFDRQMALKKLEDTNYEKYLEVCKIIGWDIEGNGSKVSGKKFCSECGHEILPGDKFCSDCGKRVETLQAGQCPNCKKINAPGARFCSDCGTKLN